MFQPLGFEAMRRPTSFLLIFVVAGLIGGCQMLGFRTAPPLPVAQEDAVYRLGPGDTLRITVYNEQNLSGEYTVNGEGNLSLNLIGAVAARNLSVPEVARLIEDKLRDGFLRDPRVSIDVLNYRPFFVLGEVRNPGKYPYVNGMTVLNAVAVAGGYTAWARENRVILVRESDPARAEWLADERTTIMPGDVIRVRERFF